jgi:hypothetical protein
MTEPTPREINLMVDLVEKQMAKREIDLTELRDAHEKLVAYRTPVPDPMLLEMDVPNQTAIITFQDIGRVRVEILPEKQQRHIRLQSKRGPPIGNDRVYRFGKCSRQESDELWTRLEHQYGAKSVRTHMMQLGLWPSDFVDIESIVSEDEDDEEEEEDDEEDKDEQEERPRLVRLPVTRSKFPGKPEMARVITMSAREPVMQTHTFDLVVLEATINIIKASLTPTKSRRSQASANAVSLVKNWAPASILKGKAMEITIPVLVCDDQKKTPCRACNQPITFGSPYMAMLICGSNASSVAHVKCMAAMMYIDGKRAARCICYLRILRDHPVSNLEAEALRKMTSVEEEIKIRYIKD